MTINGISTYSSALTGVRQSAVASGFQAAQGCEAPWETSSSSRPPRMDEASHKAALAKLQETDPALAKKMEEFHTKIDQMKEDGASMDDIRSDMKANMDSLSETEKDELKSIFGNPPQGAPPSMASASYAKNQQAWSTTTATAIAA